MAAPTSSSNQHLSSNTLTTSSAPAAALSPPAHDPASSPPLSTQAFRSARPSIVGPDDGPATPFPLALRGDVQRGFGRGGKDLGCPTGALVRLKRYLYDVCN